MQREKEYGRVLSNLHITITVKKEGTINNK
jgi:hypothetical protein